MHSGGEALIATLLLCDYFIATTSGIKPNIKLEDNLSVQGTEPLEPLTFIYVILSDLIGLSIPVS
ncbi:hypothetical protein BGX26_003377, partial [Mortierella sp. AD094]